ncbi:interleukin 19 like [Syngnathus acus]|uniref:interleukin 19 like n=1 Tax=Syngnathus acus TaxID=161584 RepID=UPI001885B623|nr:interleukin 19 like [Syngnathus acus]
MLTNLLYFSLCLLMGFVTKPVLTFTLTNTCTFSVHKSELRSYYSEIRPQAMMEDTEMRVRILSPEAMREVQEDQTCCFLRLLLRFYVERVFRNFVSNQPEGQRSASALANAFVIMRRNINKCHCDCNEITHKAIDSLQTEYDKLDTSKAAIKGVAELDTLLNWMDEVDKTSGTQPL